MEDCCNMDVMRRRVFSYFEDVLNEDERRFLSSIRRREIDEIQKALEKTTVNHNCCNYRGQRALDIAVDTRDLKLITYLIEHVCFTPTHYYCAILQAVFIDAADVLQLLLTRAEKESAFYEKIQEFMIGGPECTRCMNDVAATNMTPTMAAAIRGNVETTRILLDRGFAVEKPPNPKCAFAELCDGREYNGETLAESINRLNTYRALTSPTYLLLTSTDPILESFELSLETRRLSCELPEYQKEYLALSAQCSKFATEMLNQCRTTEEVQTILKQREGFQDPRPHRFSRLHLAVQYQQKQFVTHPSCQQVLRSMWIETIGSWYCWPWWWRATHVLKHALLTPIVSIAFIFLPKAEVLGPLRVPLHRFIYFCTSYLFFLCLLLITLLNDRRYESNSPWTWTEAAVCCFILGHTWDILTNLISRGIAAYFQSWWAIFDLLMISMFLLSEILWCSSNVFNLWQDKAEHINRLYWKWYHPILIGEGIYACASVMAFSRLLMWFQVNSRLGPLGTSVTHMVVDVFRFFMLLFIVMLAFAIGLNSIYKNYQGNLETEDNVEGEQPDDFSTLRSSFKSLFWAIFGMGEPDFAQIVGVSKNNSGVDFQIIHHFTEGVGYSLWGLYHMVTVVILLNMVIAMMTETYTRVQANADMEWKFACSTLWLSVFDYHSVVPPPFNLVPSMHRITRLFKWLRLVVSKKTTPPHTLHSLISCCHIDSEVDSCDKKIEATNYQALLAHLTRRYLYCKGQLRPITSDITYPDVSGEKLVSNSAVTLDAAPQNKDPAKKHSDFKLFEFHRKRPNK